MCVRVLQHCNHTHENNDLPFARLLDLFSDYSQPHEYQIFKLICGKKNYDLKMISHSKNCIIPLDWSGKITNLNLLIILEFSRFQEISIFQILAVIINILQRICKCLSLPLLSYHYFASHSLKPSHLKDNGLNSRIPVGRNHEGIENESDFFKIIFNVLIFF